MLCEQLPELEVVKAFNHPDVFLKEIPTMDFDLCILDIEMPGMNGLQLANLLNEKPVIFVTAYSGYAAEAFDLNAVDYVRKPVKKDRLQLAVQKAVKRIHENKTENKFIQLNTEKGRILLFFDQLSYIKVSDMDSRDKYAYLQDGNIILLKNITFKRLLELLPTNQFCRINKKELIALKKVQFFSHNEIITHIILPSGQPLSLGLSEPYRNDFIKKIKP